MNHSTAISNSINGNVLPVIRTGSASPSIVLLHFLGGSARQWSETAAILSEKFECISMDIPGFGDAASYGGFSVQDMVNQVRKTIESLKLTNFILVGHSMSGKVSLALASERLSGMRGLILLAPSPPGPEPIPNADRKEMLELSRDSNGAGKFLDGITARPLTGEIRRRAIEDFVRCSSAAWTAWLQHGSNEDWSTRIGIVQIPTLVVTGDSDKTLHVSAQQKLTLPHIRFSQIKILEHCGHLPTMEAPERLSVLISEFVVSLGDSTSSSST